MTRPRPVTAATLALGLVGLLAQAATAHAADAFLLLAQSKDLPRGPGNYLNLLKFVPVLLIYLLWVKTTDWVDDDCKELNNVRFETWNSVIFTTGVLGLAMVWVIPIYFVGLTLLLLCYFVPILTYVYVRNQTVPDDRKVLTPYHIGEVMNGLMNKMGMKGIFNRGDSGESKTGPPIVFVGKGQGGKVDNDRVAKAEESRSYMSCKELVYDAVLRRATDIHLEPTAEQMSVRYRIDGILHAAEPFDRPTGDAVLNVFKVLAAMDISEKRKPQDGSFGAKLEAREIDFRVATSGSKSRARKMVMRILDNASSVGRLDEVGLRPKLVAEVHARW